MSLSRTPVDPQAAAMNRLAKVQERRDTCLERPGYLGAEGMASKYRWISTGRARIAVLASASNDVPQDAAEPAVFTAIARISSEDLFVKADGGWEKPTTFTPKLSGVKLSFKLEEPVGYGTAQADYRHVIENLKALEKDVAVAGTRDDISVVWPGRTVMGANLIKARHALFSLKEAECTNEDDNKGDPSVEEALCDPEADAAALATYTLENWPVTSSVARAALEDMKATHILNIPPFYDMHFRILSPGEYRRQLEGALAEVRFTLTHHLIGKKPDLKNTIVADVCDVLVIYPSPPRVVTPRKSRIFAVHPSSPTKRARMA